MFGRHVSRQREYWAWFVLACLLYVLSPIDAVPEALLGPIGLIDDAVVLCAGLYGCVHWAMALGRETAVQRVPPSSSDDDERSLATAGRTGAEDASRSREEMST
jgi:uncharacterized membrane protein YkvA (DUF1232 family)